MKKEKDAKKKEPKKTTQFRGETRMTKQNKETLKTIRAIKGIFG